MVDPPDSTSTCSVLIERDAETFELPPLPPFKAYDAVITYDAVPKNDPL